jgi:DNA-binding transcriptional ArsR family regulator
MSSYQDRVQLIFRAVADPTRREILSLLARQDLTVSELAARFDMSRPAVTKHLGILSEGTLIESVKNGRERINRLQPDGLQVIKDWVEFYDQFWDEKLANLKQAVEENL